MSDGVDMSQAVSLFEALAGTSSARATRLVSAVTSAGSKQALDTIIGAGSVPSNLTNARAELLHTVTMLFGHTLSDDEVEVLFRCTKTAAKSIKANMNATYASSLREMRLAEMRQDAKAEQSGNLENGLRWQVCFESEAAVETALDELERLRRLTEITVDTTNRCIEFDQDAGPGEVGILGALGIAAPTGPRKKRKP